MLPQTIDLSSVQLEEISETLKELRWESEAHCVLLADITGQLIEAQGILNDMNTAVLSALAAGQLAATKEMARLVGEPARFKLMLHEGEKQTVYVSDVVGELILVLVLDTRIPIGMVRLSTQMAVEHLSHIIEDLSYVGAPVENEDWGDFDQLLSNELDFSTER